MELKIEEILKNKGMKMSELAKKINVDQSNLAKTLCGNPRLSSLIKIAEALDVSLQDLFSDAQPSLKEGLLRVGDRHFALVPVAVSEASYVFNPGLFYSAAYKFVLDSLKNNNRLSSLCGLYCGACPFALIYDREGQRFLFSFNRTREKYDTKAYDCGMGMMDIYYTDELVADHIVRHILFDIEEVVHD